MLVLASQSHASGDHAHNTHDNQLEQRTAKEPSPHDHNYNTKDPSARYDQALPNDHEDSTHISDKQIHLSGIKTEAVQPVTLDITTTLFGSVATPQDKAFRIFSSYESLVKQVHVGEGQTVKKGQLLLTLFNKQNLQTYTLTSPSNGEVTKRFVNTGDHADENILLEITDLSNVWIELSAFPKDIETLAKGQDILVYDMHQHKKSKGKIIYVAPIMTEGHIARARAILKNPQQHWRPGMHIKADIKVNTSKVALAIKTSALQRLDGKSVVFTKEGNEFRSRPVVLGQSDHSYTEIISGLEAGDEYVSENSFVIKADIKKDGASHDH
jgi:cobalt-zinc-cadmium efflux system membrane fusion protein